MNSTRFNIWMNELDSDKYKQGKGYLNKDNTYCVLGILCEISNCGVWKLGENNIYSYITGSNSRVIYDRFPPPAVIEGWCGLKREQAGMLCAFISSLNDKNYTFQEIKQALKEARTK